MDRLENIIGELRFAATMIAGAFDDEARDESLRRFDQLMDTLETITAEPDSRHAMNVLRSVGAVE